MFNNDLPSTWIRNIMGKCLFYNNNGTMIDLHVYKTVWVNISSTVVYMESYKYQSNNHFHSV